MKIKMKPLHTRLGISSTTLHQTCYKTKSHLQAMNGYLQLNVKPQTDKEIILENKEKIENRQVYLLWLEWATMP